MGAIVRKHIMRLEFDQFLVLVCFHVFNLGDLCIE